MKKGFALLLVLALCLSLTACGGGTTTDDSGEPAGTEEPAGEEPAAGATLESLCGEDYQTYLTEAITMQMESRMEKDPEVAYFPIQLG